MDFSPFTSVLSTNYVPSDQEKLLIHGMLMISEDKLKALNHKLAELQQQIKEVADERSECILNIEQHKALLHPIRRLPTEIIRAIFLFCTKPGPPSFTESPQNMSMDRMFDAKSAPMLLTFVCQNWRKISLDFPNLWEKPLIRIPIRRLGSSDQRWLSVVQGHSHLIRLWLSRASNRLLTISVVYCLQHYPVMDALIDPVIETSSRWQELRLVLPTPVLQRFLSIPFSSVPNIHYLDLYHSGPGLNMSFGNGMELISSPTLRGLRLTLASRQVRPLALPIQWNGLTEFYLQIDIMSGTQLLECLSKCPLLERCEISGLCADLDLQDPNPLPNDRLALPKLKFLSLEENTSFESADLALPLDLPGLSTFVFKSSSEDPSFLLCALEWGTMSLRHLTVRCPLMTDYAIQLLTKAPHLESLIISGSMRGEDAEHSLLDQTLIALTPETTSSPTAHSESEGQVVLTDHLICPELREIDLDLVGDAAFSSEAVSKFIQARSRSTPPVNRLLRMKIAHYCHGHFACTLRDSEMGVLALLKQRGVDIGGMQIDIDCHDDDYYSTYSDSD